MASANLFSPARRARQPILSPSIATLTALPSVAPAGGTGATAGGYDTAVNRDLWIDLINNERDIVSTLRTAAIATGLVGTITPFADSALFSPAYRRYRPAPSLAAGAAAPTAVAPAGGTGADAGGWSGATNRNTGIACVNGIRTIVDELTDTLTDAGAIGTDPPANEPALFSPAYRAGQPPLPATIAALTAVPTAAPAGGTGATAGCYDTAGNRNTAITTTNTLRTILGELTVGTA